MSHRGRSTRLSFRASLLALTAILDLPGRSVLAQGHALIRNCTPASWRADDVRWSRDVAPHNKIDDLIDKSSDPTFDLEAVSFAEGSAPSSREGPLTFALGGISKACGMPGMKLGWIVVGGPERLAEEALDRIDLIADTYLSVATPVQRRRRG